MPVLNRTVQHLPYDPFSGGVSGYPGFRGGTFTACVAAVLGQMAGVVLFDIVVLKELKQVDYDWSAKQGVSLTASSILLFVSVFLDFYIFSAAKYAIDCPSGGLRPAVILT